MSIFQKNVPDESQSKALQALQERMEAAESTLRTLKIEWEDVLDRMQRVMGRLNARMKASTIAQDEPPEVGPPSPEGFDYLAATRKLQARRANHGVLRRDG